MGRIGSLARETFTIEQPSVMVDDGWSEKPANVPFRIEVNGEFKWATSGSEDGKGDKETMIRTATLRVRKMEVEGLRSEMRVKRLCDDKYFNITQYYDDPANGLYMNINLRAIDD